MDRLRYSAVGFAVPLLLYGLVSTSDDFQNPVFAKGKIQSGHADISCSGCHEKSPGTYRQQLQAAARYYLGMRKTPVNFGFREVTSVQCLSCHERPNERHPIYRFQEPRFVKTLEQVEATSCLGCHSEHVNRRGNENTAFCSACHAELVMKSDPLDVSHKQLIENREWTTCLGCHDFHGNHRHATPVKYEDRYSIKAIQDYLAAGKSPYGDQLHYEATKQ